MDYDRRQVKWYWIVLFVLYSGGVLFLLFENNPYLYSHNELRAAMSRGDTLDFFTLPAKSAGTENVGPATYFSRFDAGHTGIDPLGSPRSKNYEEYSQFPVNFGEEGFTPEAVAQDSSGLYISGKSPWIFSVGLDGEVRWRFKTRDLKDDKSGPFVFLDEKSVYVVHPQGEILSLDKTNGHVRWLTHLERDVVADPFIHRSLIIVPVKGTKAAEWVPIKRADGKAVKKGVPVEIKPDFKVSETAGGKTLIVVSDNKVFAVDPEDFSIEWTQTLTDPVVGTATVFENQIYVSTLGSKIVKIDIAKKGKVEWDLELEKAPLTPPTYMPVVHRLSVALDDGQLVMVDAKLGKQLWNYNTLNKSPLADSWAVRISAKHIEEYKMDWLHKGWTVWSSCSTRHFCIFTPNKGQLIQSIALSAQPVVLPLQMEKSWIFFGKNKDGKYILSHMLELAEIKKLKAEAAKSQAQ